MRVPVLTAVTDAVWEAELVAALERGDLGVSVVRRCVDLADLLATAASGTARAALLSADLRRLDLEALSRLSVAGVTVVGLVPPGDEEAERRLRQLGVRHVLPADVGPESLSAAVVDAVNDPGVPPDATGLGDPRAALPDLAEPPEDPVLARDLDALPGTGQLVAVWGPTGAPGRTTVAVGLAAELARLGTPSLLVDADVYGGVIGQVLGILDEAPGVAAAARLANNGALDTRALADLARSVAPGLRVLTGISRAERWMELRPGAMEAVLAVCRSLVPVTVVDCAFALEQDEELSYDTTAPRRNGATLVAVQSADIVYAVGSADPVGLQRLVRGLGELRAVRPAGPPTVVVNRLRKDVVPGNPQREITAALQRYAGVQAPRFIPLDLAGLDAALAEGRTLAEAVPRSPARLALAALAADLVGAAAPAPPAVAVVAPRSHVDPLQVVRPLSSTSGGRAGPGGPAARLGPDPRLWPGRGRGRRRPAAQARWDRACRWRRRPRWTPSPAPGLLRWPARPGRRRCGAAARRCYAPRVQRHRAEARRTPRRRIDRSGPGHRAAGRAGQPLPRAGHRRPRGARSCH